MKNIISVITLLTFLFSVHVYADGGNIPVEGKWGNERVRSFAPERPVISIDGNVLSIYLADALENLAVVIADSNGLVVYQDCISSNGSGYIHTIWLSGQPGCYTFTITHQYGRLTGMFTIEP
ncbi:MAG: DUF3244 domain-containing protein [Tannerellaceae bacterium]|jgi:hypothetical protein|nr:DUF3244 domain-containing protein [Tannerellaceae bacterium]